VDIRLKPYPFAFVRRHAMAPLAPHTRCRVAIVGGGVGGLTAALALAIQGIAALVIEADDTVCFGSRAICISRRSLEILERLGAVGPILAKGLAWQGGRSFYRDREVLHFTMPDDANQKLPPMINIQQYYLEEYLVEALAAHSDLIDIRWGTRVVGVRQGATSVVLEVEAPEGPARIEADWVIATDGGRSRVRESQGMALEGTAYEGRYVIADIELDSDRPTERLAWFDPPSNPGSTLLMHRQPDSIWRIDYQLGEDEDAVRAVKPESVLPRIQAHLEMMGERGAWQPLWISLYRANALSLPSYRAKRILFAGDAAHLVPIFGVRGANSTIDDADNLAWKLACVLKGAAPATLLDSYSEERVYAARENLKQGMKSTEFMAPPNFAFRHFREAVLELAGDTPALRTLINPRQSTAIRYADSRLVAPDSAEEEFAAGPAAGAVLAAVPAQVTRQDGTSSASFVADLVAPGRFLLVQFGGGDAAREHAWAARSVLAEEAIALDVAFVADAASAAWALYDAAPAASYLVRPDGHVIGRWRQAASELLVRSVRRSLTTLPRLETP
jgi:3-(3-hydroxy-phenyl)propionate hydroxylase